MNILMQRVRRAALPLLLSVAAVHTAGAAEMKDYCIVPPFIGKNVSPNVLLMIDNSSSMYDLSYADEGKKVCSTSGAACTYDTDCPSGQSCTFTHVNAREPYYCYDETYQSTKTYVGYFNPATYYSYRSGSDDFAPLAGAFPGTCTTEAGYTVRSVTTPENAMCVKFLTASPRTLASFVAKGNYLNWMSASKFDVQKKILTGGKYDGTRLVSESRGCVGQPYVKDANTADFVNYAKGAANPNTSALVTFMVQSASNPFNPTAPAPGGTTYIKLYAGNQPYNAAACQKAVDDLVSGGNADIKQSVSACLAASMPVEGSCQQMPLACSSATDCVRVTTIPRNVYVCDGGNADVRPSVAVDCTTNGVADDSKCHIAARNSCDLDPTIACVSDHPGCDVPVPEQIGTCGVYTPQLPKNTDPIGPCRTYADCTVTRGNTDYTADCIGHEDARTDYKGPCIMKPEQNYGTCRYNDVGGCLMSGEAAMGAAKVDFQQNMQACWSLRGTCANNSAVTCYSDAACPGSTCSNTPIGTDDVNTIEKRCPDMYASYKVCSDNTSQTCTENANCASNNCLDGPGAIVAGSPALICGTNYAGQLYYKNASNAWVLRATLPASTPVPCAAGDSVEACMKKIHAKFCGDFESPPVTDPTDAPGDTSQYDNLPAILSGIGVQGQLGAPIASMRAAVAAAEPTGLVQEFGGRVRIGVMSFNFDGSASEIPPASPAPISAAPKVCSNDKTRGCSIDADCGTGNTCGTTSIGTTNLDGGKVLYPVGKGVCATAVTVLGTSPPVSCNADSECDILNNADNRCINGTCRVRTTTVCATDSGCTGANQVCVSNGVGSHTEAGTLVNTIDQIRANAWTPFSEAFYNAIGYFARTSSGASRTDLRINPTTAVGNTLVCSNDYSHTCTFSSDCDPGATCIPLKDYDETLNPSQVRCQQNYVLLISDGMSTADRNPAVSSTSAGSPGLAWVYHTAAGKPAVWDNTCSYYGGSKNLPILSWLAKNRNIATFSKVTASTELPTQGRDNISTYVVYNGDSSGVAGECNSLSLLTDTAANGGTTLKHARNPAELESYLRSIFEELAAKSASGTAASILSNSEGSGANILQAVFYPRKVFENQSQAYWIGELQNLWYYVDPFIGNSSLREETNGLDPEGKYNLELQTDRAVEFYFDAVAGITKVNLFSDANADGDAETPVVGSQGVSPDTVNSLWRAGALLWARNSPRTIYTPCNVANASDTNAAGGTCEAGTGLMKMSWASPDNSSALQGLLQYPAVAGDPAATALAKAAAVKLMQYTSGIDFLADPTMRSRTVEIGGVTGVWKLGDIISSTPRLQSSVRQNAYNVPRPIGYGDLSYGNDGSKTGYIYNTGFTTADSRVIPSYASRGIVYAGANDGMLHAFKLGTLTVTPSADKKASLGGSDLGQELWAFVPQNVLPYLRYLADPNYGHLYYMDGNTTIIDAAVGKPEGCTSTNYWDCSKDRSTGKGTNWRTVLVGGMGIGGASRDPGTDERGACTDGASGSCVKTPIPGVGYSAYYALDVTNPTTPKFLWEFSDAAIPAAEDRGLGYSTSGSAVIKINARVCSITRGTSCALDSECPEGETCSFPLSDKNGRWFAVFGSGPTGPIDKGDKKFMGNSNQPLKVYVVDLYATPPFVKNVNFWVFGTGDNQIYDGGNDAAATVATAGRITINNAFSGSIINGSIDVDRWNGGSTGNYQDDALYFGYSEKDVGGTNAWTKGGILKLVTNQDPNPANWKLIKVFDGTGPVTTAVSRLQDRKRHALWLYFGTGRYFYLHDDFDTGRKTYGIKEPCYRDGLNASPVDTLDHACAVKHSDGQEQAQNFASPTAANSVGWSVAFEDRMGSGDNVFGGERVITDTVAMPNGTVFVTTYKPNYDLCQYGGKSFIWALNYESGGFPTCSSIEGKALVQVSTGAFEQVSLADFITCTLPDGTLKPPTIPNPGPDHPPGEGVNDPSPPVTPGMTGKPPQIPPPIITKGNLKPVKKVIHIQEK